MTVEFTPGGQYVDADGSESIPVTNPTTEEALAAVTSATGSEVEAAIEAAEDARYEWGKRPAQERGQLVRVVAGSRRPGPPSRPAVPLGGPDVGGLHACPGTVVDQALPDVPGVESREVVARQFAYQERGEHRVLPDSAGVGLVAGVGAGVSPAAVPRPLGIGVLAV